MRRAEAKLQLSHNVVGDDTANQENKELVGVEGSDLRSIIFGLHIFDSSEFNNEQSSELKIPEISAMAEKVIAMRHEQIAGTDNNKFEVNPTDILDKCDVVSGANSATYILNSGFDEASYLSWVENFKESSQETGNQIVELGTRRNLPEDKHRKLEAGKKKAEDKKLSKWEASGYHSLSVKEPIDPTSGDIISDSGSVQFVYGDCTDPSKVCPSESTIIFRLV